MNDTRDEVTDSDFARLEDRLDRKGQAARQVLVLGGEGYSADTIERLLADKGFAGEQYTVITRGEAVDKGLLFDDIGEPIPPPTPFPRRRPTTKPAPHAERDRWNAAVDEQKAAKRRAKGK